MIRIAERVAVDASVDEVWKVLSDLPTVVSCIPGAELLGDGPDGFEVAITVRFGPMRIGFSGSGTVDFDERERSGRVEGKGRDRRGATKTTASGVFAVVPAGEAASEITADGEVRLSGPLVGVVERGAQFVVAGMARDFAKAVAARCGQEREVS
ncbi:SRPBCC domain-containing protein [Gryllotalpicola protaetiae]|uniref:SRPBCC domain-containing protein n=1 Tax=Gryllotalpicola protaetiae TaxID=2419771 RepID=UPI0013C4EF1A|nr:SRPBCC domain-containing protein [Gryllotalpicola protaetiae]